MTTMNPSPTADTAVHAETDTQGEPAARQGHAQTHCQARIQRLAATHRSTHARHGDRQPDLLLRASRHAETDPDRHADSATTSSRWCDRLRTR